eukprot:347538-Chlamydomonas_euryale.AAC.1
MHAIGMVHRDIKLSNVLAAKGSKDDFGTNSCLVGKQQRQLHACIHAYMFPLPAERCEGINLDGPPFAPRRSLTWALRALPA